MIFVEKMLNLNTMKNVHIILMLLGGLLLIGCQNANLFPDLFDCKHKGEGEIVSRNIEVSDFSGVELSSSTDAVIIQSDEQRLVFIGHSNIIDRITTEVSNGVLDIDFMSGSYCDYELAVEIYTPAIKYVSASSSSDVVVEDFIGQTELELEASSSGNITINKFEGISRLVATAKSSGDIVANEDILSVENLIVNVSSSGDFDGFPIHSDNCIVDASSSGDASVYAGSTLDVSVSSSADVFYKGTPFVTQDVSSSGAIVNAN